MYNPCYRSSLAAEPTLCYQMEQWWGRRGPPLLSSGPPQSSPTLPCCLLLAWSINPPSPEKAEFHLCVQH